MIPETLLQSVQSYIERHYIPEHSVKSTVPCTFREERRPRAGGPGPVVDAAPMAAPAVLGAAPPDLARMLREADAGFSETLLRLIDRAGKRDSEVYKKANIDRKLFSKIRRDPAYRPSKATALALAVALELDLDETRDLIGRAGYALSHSSKFDIIVEYFILQKNYNVMELNETLFYFDQPLLGA